jgi:hypothetical protein
MVGSKNRNHDLRFSCHLVQIVMSLNARYGVVAQALIGPRRIAQALCSGWQKAPKLAYRSAETRRWSKPPSGTARSQFKPAGAISRLLACHKKQLSEGVFAPPSGCRRCEADGIAIGAATRRYWCSRGLAPMGRRGLELELAAGENTDSGDAQKRRYNKGNQRKPHGIAPRWRRSARGMCL